MAKRSRTPMSSLQRLAVGFLSVVVLLAVGVLLLSIARVRVTITPRAEAISVDFDLTVIGSGKPSDREVLGRLVRVDGTGSGERAIGAATPGLAAVDVLPPARAEGTVTLMSRMASPQPLVATTRLLSPDGVLFRLKSGVTIPANGKLDGVRVYADQVGSHGNIGPTKFTIPGLSAWLQARVWAESGTAMSGGQGAAQVGSSTAAPRLLVTAADIDAARVQATDAAMMDAQRRAEALAKDGEEVVRIATDTQVTVRGAVGEARDRVNADATVRLTAILIPKGVADARARAALETVAQSSGRTLLRMRPDALRTRLIAQDPALARATIAVHAEGDASIRGGSFTFEPRRISGFTGEEVRTYLRSLPGVQDVEVQLKPFWVKRVPSNVGSVEVEVREVR